MITDWSNYSITFDGITHDVHYRDGVTLTASTGFVPNSPTPFYQAPITSSGDEGYLRVVSSGKNWFDKDNITDGRIDTTHSVNGTVITVTGKWYVQYLVTVTKYTDYYLNYTRLSGNGYISIFTTPDGISVGSSVKGTTGTFNSGNNTRLLIFLYASTGTEGTTIFDNVQLELGTTATTYTPYQGYTTTDITLPAGFVGGSLPSGVADTVDDLGRAVGNIGKIIIDGTTVKVQKNGSAVGTYLYYAVAPLKTKGIGWCNYFTHYYTYPSVPSKAGMFNSTESAALYFNGYGIVSADNATLTNADEFNAWFASRYAAGNPVVVYYQKDTPLIATIPQTEVDTWAGNTVITTDNGVKPYLTVKYTKG